MARRYFNAVIKLIADTVPAVFGITAGGVFSECLLDRPDFYGGNQCFVYVRIDPLLHGAKVGASSGRLDCNQHDSFVFDPAVYSQYEIGNFLVERDGALHYSLLSGDAGGMVFFQIYRYLSGTLWNRRIAVHDCAGGGQLSGGVVGTHGSCGASDRLWEAQEEIPVASDLPGSRDGRSCS